MLNTSKFNALTISGGGYYEERRQALGYGLSPIDSVGGDSYGK